MDVQKNIISKLPFFANLTAKEVDQVLSIARTVSYDDRSVIFKEGDHAGALFVLLEGSIQISTMVQDEIEKPLATLRPGSVFGEVSLIDQNAREVKATAIESCKLLVIDRANFETLLESNPELTTKILTIITRTVVDRIRLTTEQFRRNIQWSLDISGALHMSWRHLITDEVELNLSLANGTQISGKLIKVEKDDLTHEFFVKDKSNKIVIVPYHAILSLTFNREAAARFKGSREEH
jgi:CRP-like cAMP-binding protein